jgi:hypothetical protein
LFNKFIEEGRVIVKETHEQVLHIGDKVIDDQSNPFIHRLVCRDPLGKKAIGLHAYGASSFQHVIKVFMDSQPEHEYQDQDVR